MMLCNCLAISDGDINEMIGALFSNTRVDDIPATTEKLYLKLVGNAARKGYKLHNKGFCPPCGVKVRGVIAQRLQTHNDNLAQQQVKEAA